MVLCYSSLSEDTEDVIKKISPFKLSIQAMISGTYLVCYWDNLIYTHTQTHTHTHPRFYKANSYSFYPRAQWKIEGICESLEYTVCLGRVSRKIWGCSSAIPLLKRKEWKSCILAKCKQKFTWNIMSLDRTTKTEKEEASKPRRESPAHPRRDWILETFLIYYRVEFHLTSPQPPTLLALVSKTT